MIEGHLKYVLSFQDAPWRDGEELLSATAIDIGDRIGVPAEDGTTETWEVGDIWREAEGDPETLHLFRP
jgi:hypothetical protein